VSVINKMLTDLERRQGGSDGAAIYVAPARGQGWWMLLLTLICGLALGILGWRSWAYWQQSHQQMPPLTQAAAPVTAAEDEPVDLVVALPTPSAQAVANALPEQQSPSGFARSEPTPSPDDIAPVQQRETLAADLGDPVPAQQLETLGPDYAEAEPEQEPSDAQLQPDLYAELDAAREADAQPVASASRRPASLKIETVELSQAELAALSERKATAALAKGQLREAEAQFIALLRQTPDNEEARQQLAGLLYGQGRLAEASALLEDGIRRQPAQADFRLLLARLALAEGDKQRALGWLGGAKPPLASNLDYYATWAGLRQELGQNAEAADLYVQLLRVQPDQGRWWLGLGIAEDGQGHSQRAKDAYRNALLHGELGEASQVWLSQRMAQLGP
jgi:MSHA biogenesis protein MshN